MVQAARSGRQNIAEGSRASGTSSQIEIRLVGVARASLDELLLDYEDFLRQRRQPLWGKDDVRARNVRAMGRQSSDLANRPDHPATPYDRYRDLVENGTPQTAANTVICLIHQANYLLDRQLHALESDFIQRGGYTEQLAAARRKYRVAGSHQSDSSDQSSPADPPACPKCGQPMTLRTARRGLHSGSQFWGCQNYPDCNGTRPKKKP